MITDGDIVGLSVLGILFVICTICICCASNSTAAAADGTPQIPITNAAAPQVQNNTRQLPITNAAARQVRSTTITINTNGTRQLQITNVNAAALQVRSTAITINIGVHAPPPPPPPQQGNVLRCLVYDTYYRNMKKEGSSSREECAICLEGYDDGVLRAATDACNHRFHALCIEGWLQQHTSCPICRHHLLN